MYDAQRYYTITQLYVVSWAQTWDVSWSNSWVSSWGLGWADLHFTPAGPLLCEVILTKGRARLRGGSRKFNGMLTRSLNVLHPLLFCPLCFNYNWAPDKCTVWKSIAGGKLSDTVWCCHLAGLETLAWQKGRWKRINKQTDTTWTTQLTPWPFWQILNSLSSVCLQQQSRQKISRCL